jgi:hypothetical protein
MENFIEINKNGFMFGFKWIKEYLIQVLSGNKYILQFFAFMSLIYISNSFFLQSVSSSLTEKDVITGGFELSSPIFTIFVYILYYTKVFSIFLYANMIKEKSFKKSFQIFLRVRFYFHLLITSLFLLLIFYFVIWLVVPSDILQASDEKIITMLESSNIMNYLEDNTTLIIAKMLAVVLVLISTTVIFLYSFYLYVIEKLSINIFQSYQYGFQILAKNYLAFVSVFLFSFLFLYLENYVNDYIHNIYLIMIWGIFLKISFYSIWMNSIKDVIKNEDFFVSNKNKIDSIKNKKID